MKNKRMESLQLLRAIAFLCIFTSHLGINYFGGIGVEVFLVLSGFLMFYNYAGKDVVQHYSIKDAVLFSKSKIEKLYGLHIVMLIVAIPFLVLYNIKKKYSIYKMITKLLLNIFLIQSWIPIEEYRYSMNNLSWYLCVCAFVYFLFPYIKYILLDKRVNVHRVIVSTIILIVLQILVGLSVQKYFVDPQWVQGLTYNSPLYRTIDFIVGCNIAYIYMNVSQIKKFLEKNATIMELVSAVIVIVTEVLVYKIWNIEKLMWMKNTVILIPATCFVLLVFVTGKGLVLRKLLSVKWLLQIGNLSAYAYLIHELVIRYINFILSRLMGIQSNIYIAFVVGLIAFVITMIMATGWKKIKEINYEASKSKKYKA